jgi:hypothetical protein
VRKLAVEADDNGLQAELAKGITSREGHNFQRRAPWELAHGQAGSALLNAAHYHLSWEVLSKRIVRNRARMLFIFRFRRAILHDFLGLIRQLDRPLF